MKVTRNYQVTIPEEVRKIVKLNEGDTVEIEALNSDQVILKRVIPLEELKGAWANDSEIDNAMGEVERLWKTGRCQRNLRRYRHSDRLFEKERTRFARLRTVEKQRILRLGSHQLRFSSSFSEQDRRI